MHHLIAHQEWLKILLYILHHNKIYQTRRDKVVDCLQGLGLHVTIPKASLYVWAKIPDGEESSSEFVSKIIDATASHIK